MGRCPSPTWTPLAWKCLFPRILDQEGKESAQKVEVFLCGMLEGTPDAAKSEREGGSQEKE